MYRNDCIVLLSYISSRQDLSVLDMVVYAYYYLSVLSMIY